MVKTTIQVEGMMCEHCEARVTKAIQEAFGVSEVKADRNKKSAEIVAAEALDAAKLTEVVTGAGYKAGEVTSAAC